MSIVEVRTAVGAPEEPHIQPGDLVSATYVGHTNYGRVFSVDAIAGIAYVWWSEIGVTTTSDGLVGHNVHDLRFEERPAQYLAVLRQLEGGVRYGFVVAGVDVSTEEYAFEQSRSYDIVSRRTRATIEAAMMVGEHVDATPGEIAGSNECEDD